MCEPMGGREKFLTFELLVEIEGHFTNEFVSCVHETEDWTSSRTAKSRLPTQTKKNYIVVIFDSK
jgi:hypothetical protein